MRRLAQGHLDTRLRGARDRTSNLPFKSQPALPPELSQPPVSTPGPRPGSTLPQTVTAKYHRLPLETGWSTEFTDGVEWSQVCIQPSHLVLSMTITSLTST